MPQKSTVEALENHPEHQGNCEGYWKRENSACVQLLQGNKILNATQYGDYVLHIFFLKYIIKEKHFQNM